MTALDLAVVEGLRQRVADLEARLAATEDALSEARARLAGADPLPDDGEDDAPPVDSVEAA